MQWIGGVNRPSQRVQAAPISLADKHLPTRDRPTKLPPVMDLICQPKERDDKCCRSVRPQHQLFTLKLMFACVLYACDGSASHPQPVQVLLIDQNDGRPVPSVRVQLGSAGAFTDQSGVATFLLSEVVLTRQVLLKTEHEAFLPTSTSVEPKPGSEFLVSVERRINP